MPTALLMFMSAGLTAEAQRFRHVASKAEQEVTTPVEEVIIDPDSLLRIPIVIEALPDSFLRVRDVWEILDQTKVPADRRQRVNVTFGPRVFSGYRRMLRKDFEPTDFFPIKPEYWRVWEQKWAAETPDSVDVSLPFEEVLVEDEGLHWGALDSIPGAKDIKEPLIAEETEIVYNVPEAIAMLNGEYLPDWLHDVLTAERIQQDFAYTRLIDDPSLIQYSYWGLPVPPRLPEEDHSFAAYIKKLNLPEVDVNSANILDLGTSKKHWLHVFNTALQFSQAYLSENWYQGGNNYLSLLFNFLWDVQLNQVWHPNLIFQSTFSYKLGLNTEQNDPYRKYSISQDLLQYNMKFGYKAAHNWYYTITTQFKTQMLNNYKKNTETRLASFLSPGELNVGVGMTYSKQNKGKTVTFNASIAPVSYNLKICLDDQVEHTQFKIPVDGKTHSEIGSSAELTFKAVMFKNVTYNTRLFLFSDYKDFQGDWENTLNFQFNRFFSTQLFFHLRYDTKTSAADSPDWKHWMLKEILSVGLSYNFSTK